jgi:hypothetical protein
MIIMLTKLKVATTNILHVTQRPSYFFLAVAGAWLMAGFVIWSLSFDTLLYILFDSGLPLTDRLNTITGAYRSLYGDFGGLVSTSIILFTSMFGLNVSLLVYVVRQRGRAAVSSKSTGGSFFVAIFSAGCVSCGTSLLAPVLATVGITSGVAVLQLGAMLNFIAAIILLYSVYRLSKMIVRHEQS